MIPINKNPEFLRLEGSQLFTRVSGYFLREINSYKKTKRIIGDKIGHVIVDRRSIFEIKDDLDIKIARIIGKNTKNNY